MITTLSKVFLGVLTKVFYAFFTERLISKLIVELLRMLAKKTTNTIDDNMVSEIASNLKI
ncbi:MAG: hypothetical protein C0602_12345 [Denitrovibrio sp.]|nr:MAG: hypothetical protein C0602_12345 [Denitrovibrio sp.]